MSPSADASGSPDEQSTDNATTRSLSALTRGIAAKTFPLYLSMVAGVIGTLVTAAVLGHTGTTSLAAYAMTVAVFNPAVMVVQGALRGSMPFVSQSGDDPGELESTFRDAMWLALCAGVLGGLAVAAVPALATLIGAPEATLAAFGPFPYLMALTLVVVSFQTSATTLLIALGRSKEAMWTGLVNTGSSLVLIPSLVLGPGPLPALGMTGAGVAMFVNATAALATAHLLSRHHTALNGRRVGLGRPVWSTVWRMALVGLPMGSTMLIKFGVLGVLAMSAATAGVADAAAHQIMITLATFVFLPATAVGQATVPFMARASADVDRHGYREVRRSLLAGACLALPVVAASALLVFLVAHPVLGLFTPDPRVQALVIALLPVLFVVVVADGAQALPGMGLLAIKRTTPTLYTFAVCFGSLALIAFPVAAAGGLTWLWTAYAVASLGLVLGQAGSFLRFTVTRP
ncbi:MATE family efflux transporter [Nocardiopsis listeri]|uniref:MATE family efflux transporter n=1 Tax=Nocardiopsis listeri TaxID=53440 RepID=UPI00083324F5|nr:MATE family efflux transporter [Nocardiopsis listeri]